MPADDAPARRSSHARAFASDVAWRTTRNLGLGMLLFSLGVLAVGQAPQPELTPTTTCTTAACR